MKSTPRSVHMEAESDGAGVAGGGVCYGFDKLHFPAFLAAMWVM